MRGEGAGTRLCPRTPLPVGFAGEHLGVGLGLSGASEPPPCLLRSASASSSSPPFSACFSLPLPPKPSC